MTQWLDPDQQRSWRSWIAANTLLTARLSRELQASHDLSMADYEILVRLSEADDDRLRMSVLAETTMSSRSRLTHQVDRLEKAGIVRREACPSDRRGQHAVLTETGWELLRMAAPTHVAGVRTHLVDVLTPEQFAMLGQISQLIVDALDRDAPGADPAI
jgi:DNA-binding MarR family transcriptional regulator